MSTPHAKAAAFRALHQAPGAFVIANAWDAGSAKMLTALGFPALATSSGAHAGVMGRLDGQVTLNAVKAAGTIEGDKVVAQMRGAPIPDKLFGPVIVRAGPLDQGGCPLVR